MSETMAAIRLVGGPLDGQVLIPDDGAGLPPDEIHERCYDGDLIVDLVYQRRGDKFVFHQKNEFTKARTPQWRVLKCPEENP